MKSLFYLNEHIAYLPLTRRLYSPVLLFILFLAVSLKPSDSDEFKLPEESPLLNESLACPVMIGFSDGSPYCETEEISLRITVDYGVPPYNITLSDGSSTINLPSFSGNSYIYRTFLSTSTTFSIQSYSDGAGCTTYSANPHTVTIHETPTANDITAPQNTVDVGNNLQLTANGFSIYGESALVYEWEFVSGMEHVSYNSLSIKTPTFTGVSAGTVIVRYRVKLDDSGSYAHDCYSGWSNEFSFDVIGGCPTISASLQIFDPFCEGDDVPVQIFITGGTGPYSITINDGTNNHTYNNINDGETRTIPNIAPNNNTFTVTQLSDANSCPGTTGNTFDLFVGPLPTIDDIPDQNISVAQTTIVDMNPSGGTGRYESFIYTVVSGNTAIEAPINPLDGTLEITGFSPGTANISYQVKDSLGCFSDTKTFDVIVTAGCPTIEANPIIEHLHCEGVDVLIDFSFSNGAPPFFVNVNDGLTDSIYEVVQADTFINVGSIPVDSTVTFVLSNILDNSGCPDTATYSLETTSLRKPVADPISGDTVVLVGDSITLSSNPVPVNGNNVFVEYNWTIFSGDVHIDTIRQDSQLVVIGLNPGIAEISYTTRDSNACFTLSSDPIFVEVIDCDPISVNLSANDPICSGEEANIRIDINEGVPPYTITINDGLKDTVIIGNSNTVIYTVAPTTTTTYLVKSIQPGNGCPAEEPNSSIEIMVTELSLSFATTESTCNENNGSITATVTGGMDPVDFMWSNGESTATINNLTPGTYQVTATDGNNCSVTGSAIVNSAGDMEIACSVTQPVSIVNGSDGIININIINGTPPFTITSNITNFGTQNGALGNNPFSGLPEGTFEFTVTDDNGCADICLLTIEGPNCNLTASGMATPPTCAENSDGIINLNIQNGTAPFDYNWTNETNTDNGTGTQIIDLSSGNYQVTIVDALGCADTIDVTIPNVDPIEFNLTENICQGEQFMVGNSTFELTGEYTIPLIATNGCDSIVRLSLTVNPNPTITADPVEYNFCEGETLGPLQVNPSVGATVDWYDSPTGGNLLFSDTNPLTVNAPGSYYAEAREAASSCISSNRIEITVNLFSNPILTIDNNSFSCNDDFTSYQFEFNTSVNNPTANFGTITLIEGDRFQITGIPTGQNVIVQATDENSCLTEVTAQAPNCDCGDVTINAPVFDGDNPTEICENETIPTLTVSVDNGLVVDWYDAATNGNLVAEGTNSFTPNQAGTFFAESRNPNNDCTSNTRTAIELVFLPLPTFNQGAFSCSDDLSSYQIEFSTEATNTIVSDFGTVSTISGNQFLLSGIPAGQDVTLQITDGNNCTLEVNITAPNCDCSNITINAPVFGGNNPTEICENETIPTLTVSVDEEFVVDWYDAATNGNLLAEGTNSFTPTQAGTFFAESRNPNNSCVSDTRTAIELVFLTVPTFNQGAFTCSDDLSSYQFEFNTEATNTITSDFGSVSIISDDQFLLSGIPAGQNVTLQINGENNCLLEVNVAAPNCNCSNINVNAPVFDGNNPTEICENETIPTLTVRVDDGLVVDWYDAATDGNLLAEGTNSFTPTQAGTFFAESRDPNNDCPSNERTSIELILHPLPSFNRGDISCNEDFTTYTFTFNSNGIPDVSAGNLVDQGNGNYQVEGIPADTQLDILLVDENTDCSITQTINAPDCECVDPVTASITEQICFGQTFNFNGTELTTAGTYLDTLTNASVNGCDSIITLTLEVTNQILTTLERVICETETLEFCGETISEAGNYQCTFTSVGGCDSIVVMIVNDLSVSESFNLETDQSITITEFDEPTTINLLEGVEFDESNFSLEIFRTPSHGSFSQISTTEYEYLANQPIEAETDTVLFRVCNNNCQAVCDTGRVILIFSNDCLEQVQANIPNVFTPNGDGINDVFDPLEEINDVCLQSPQSPAIRILNRWGDLVYSMDQYIPWDGRSMEGKTVPQGTYYYIITFQLDEKKMIRGPINVIGPKN